MAATRKVRSNEIEKCYGTKRRVEGKDQCPRRANCPWGEACLSLASESSEAAHYHYVNISLDEVLTDKDTLDGNGSPEQNLPPEIADAISADKDGHSEANNGPAYVQLGDMNIPIESYETVCAFAEKLAHLYFEMPTVFDTLMRKIWKGQNQSAVAKEKGITRQGLNKTLLKETGLAQKRNDIQERRDRELAAAKQEYADKVEELREKDELFMSLSDRDWKIYKLVFVDGCSFQSAAKQMGLHKQCVYRVVTFLRSKMAKNVTFRPGRKPKK